MFDEAKLEEKVKNLKAGNRKLKNKIKDESKMMFEFMDEHEQIKNLHDRINNMKAVSTAQQKLNGELRKEVDDLKKDMMILKNDIREKDLEIGKMMRKLQH